MMRNNKKQNGTITVFLSMIILLVISIVITSIENARVTSAYVRSGEITYMALDSCFSSYVKEIFDEYGLMMLWKNDTEFISLYNTYVNKNSEYRKEFAIAPIDYLALKHTNSFITDKTMVTDGDCEFIERQINDYMKFAVSEDVIEQLVMNSESLSQSENVSKFNESLETCSEALSNVENSVAHIQENVENIKSVQENPVEALEAMKHRLEELRAEPIDDNEYGKAVRDDIFNLYKQEYRKYNEWHKAVGGCFDNIILYTEEYFENTQVAEDRIGEVEKELEDSRESFSRDIFQVMEEEIGGIREQILSFDTDTYNVAGNRAETIKQKSIFDNVTDDMASVMEEMEELDYSGNKISLYDKDGTFTERLYKCVTNALEDIQGYHVEGMGVNYQKGSSSKKKNEIVELVKKIKKDGVVNYVVAGELSQKKIDNAGRLPSKDIKSSAGKEWKKYTTSEESVRKALVGQYIFDKFYCYTDASKGYIDYEVEYIISGKMSDKENITEIIDKIIAIREGFNLIYLMKDSEKREEAHAMAVAITGFTGMPVIIRITQFLIISAWAYAESIVDVRDLLAGYRVKILKSSEEWNLSLEGVKNIASSVLTEEGNHSENDKKKNRSGLSYQDYLRYFLFSQNRSEQVYRILDVIQLNMCSKYNDKFAISECMLRMEIDTEYQVKRLFTDIGFVKRRIGDKGENFTFEITKAYGY